MNKTRSLTLAAPALASLIFTAVTAQAAPVPPTDNTSAPYMGVYEWSPSSPNCDPRVETFKGWLSRTRMWVEEFAPPDSWANISGGSWMLNAAVSYLNAHPGTTYVLTVPLLPWDPSDHTKPLSGTSLAQGAAAEFNDKFELLAQRLKDRLLNDGSTVADHTIIRLGHEFNGTWYPWKVITHQDAADFAAYWRQVHTAMKANAPSLKFCWNGNPGWTEYTLIEAYPGDAYVDYIGVDMYDQSWTYYPYPANATQAQIDSARTNAWSNGYAANWNNGLAVWKNFAASRGKPLAIPEWGLNKRTDNRGGLDNPYFIQKMYDFIQEPANNVAFHIYFDVIADAANNHQVSPAAGYTTQFPNAAALFQKLFAPWVDQDIGGATPTGSGSKSGSSYTIKGGGTGFASTSDQFNFYSRGGSGNQTFQARITGLTNTNAGATGGLMLRASTAAGAPYVMLCTKPGGALEFRFRLTAGTASNYTGTSTGVTPSATTPIWLRLVKNGQMYNGYYSTSVTTPATWTALGAVWFSTDLPANYRSGFAVHSHTTTLTTALFDNVTP